MTGLQQHQHEFTVFHLFCGVGGGALGFELARREYKGVAGSFRTVGGIDSDPRCVEDFNRLTNGKPGTVMDLFDRQQYVDFHGEEPPADWHEAAPEDIRKAAHGVCPDVVFLSPPCKGFSGLLPEKSAKTPKYQALNRLTVRSMRLTLDAFGNDLPAVILIENVPRITRRGAALLNEIMKLLGMYGYEFHQGTHDCGEIGGLGQTRKRYLLIARNPRKLMSFIYEPPKYRLKSIGEVLETIPLPGDVERAGKMHRVPNLQWKTWVRLALIPAGKDWRALNRDCYAHLYHIVPWDKHSNTIAGGYRPNNGAVSVADPRLDTIQGFGSKFRVAKNDEPAPTVTGSRIGSGGLLYGDPKLDYTPRSGSFRVVRWDEPAPAITGSTGAGRSNGISGVADPRVKDGGRFHGSYGVNDWGKPAPAMTAALNVKDHKGAVADPRTDYRGNWKRTSVSKVQDWNEPSDAIISNPNIHGSGTSIVADPRLSCSPRAGAYGVNDWDGPAATVSGTFDIDNRPASVADPRIPDMKETQIPADKESGVWVILAEDGSWHRPITTYEMAMLQGLPETFRDGSPLVLAGNSEKVWREHIGNMVPPPAACAIAGAILETMMPNVIGEEWFWNVREGAKIWVQEDSEPANEVITL